VREKPIQRGMANINKGNRTATPDTIGQHDLYMGKHIQENNKSGKECALRTKIHYVKFSYAWPSG
jgi:hypothetical protein